MCVCVFEFVNLNVLGATMIKQAVFALHVADLGLILGISVVL